MLPSINEIHDKTHDILFKCLSLNGFLNIIKPNINNLFPTIVIETSQVHRE